MRPAARIQAAIDLLDAIIHATRNKGAPADRLIADYFKQRRYAGSKDRRAVRELVYASIRACGPVPANGRAAMLKLAQSDRSINDLFDGSEHGPKAIGKNDTRAKGGIAPDWLVKKLTASGLSPEEQASLLDRAPLDVRVNTLKTTRDAIVLPEAGEVLSAPDALRFPTGTKVEQWEAYQDGLIEIQDHGSQLICDAVPIQSGDTVIDLCAGAGGKTLALAAKLANTGELIAADTDKRRLGNLAPRAARANAGVAHTVLLDPGKEMEALEPWQGKGNVVLVDAPCSGIGTWRRNPETRWRLSPAELERLTKLQDYILEFGSKLVSPGGCLAYATCSLLDEEGTDRIGAFLKQNPGWTVEQPQLELGERRGEGLRLTPYQHGTDGFFVAILRSPC